MGWRVRKSRPSRRQPYRRRPTKVPPRSLTGTMLGLASFTALFIIAIVVAFQTRTSPSADRQNQMGLLTTAQDRSPGAPRLPEARVSDSQRDVAGASTGQLPTENVEARFETCGAIRITCVVDGDTFWLNRQKIRIADIDTPEISQPQCQGEYDLGMAAKARLIALLNGGPFELRSAGSRDIDNYGRLLRLVIRNEVSIGDQLVEEGLAHRWVGHKQSWC